MIQINYSLKDPIVYLWMRNNEDKPEFCGVVENYLQMTDICIQIKKLNTDKYFFYYNDMEIPIAADGKLWHTPEGFYDLQNIQLDELLFGYSK